MFTNVGGALEQNWTRIQLFDDAHCGYAGLGFAVNYGPIDGRGATVLGQ